MTSAEKRTVRSFVRRTGRMTRSQRRALDALWPTYGLEFSTEPLDFTAVFGRDSRRVLEIGFGNGDSLVEQAARHRELDFIGVEVHWPGIGHCLIQAERAALDNLRVISHDAIDVLQQQIGEATLDRVNLYFPDPWPKKRHHKRRILQPGFLGLLASRLAPGGSLHIATDWAPYAEHIDGILDSSPAFELAERRAHGGDQPLDRPTTKFERRGLGKGHQIVDWRLVRI
ncbi:MAG: tRNA (guanosine(46)-N7)-methyltransferase TrmB [Gammaproteobacteria bacterium]|nr:tRNA (guanosine(46)-N7)-methyltransferase TrmB [Gammaproteobacteria bacterium]